MLNCTLGADPKRPFEDAELDQAGWTRSAAEQLIAVRNTVAPVVSFPRDS